MITQMNIFESKYYKLPGSNYKEVIKKARKEFQTIERHTKRKPYVRSAYFNKQKVFFDYFWRHLFQKREPERTRRLKYFSAGIDLIKNSKNHPDSMQNPNKQSEILHRFAGRTKEKELFYLQIKEHKRTKKLQLMSMFRGKE